jgi:hypothetical protein
VETFEPRVVEWVAPLEMPLVLLVLVLTITYVQRFRPKDGRRSSAMVPPLPPGPQPWPVVGNLPEMMLKKPTFRWRSTS